MNKLFLSVILILLITTAHSQLRSSAAAISYNYRVDTLYSDTLKETRFIKVSLPDEFAREKTYPVFITLDESWMFEPVMVTVKQLTEAKVIPPSIVIGIHSNNRSKDLRMGSDGNFTSSSRAFYHYLNNELFAYLSKNITTPAFPVLIGHSDGAVFSQKAMAQQGQRFRAVLALSPQLEKGQLQEIKAFTERVFPDYRYHFAASGTKDASGRLKAVIIEDSLFKTVRNPNLHLKSVIYEVDHFAVANRALADGISFVFKDFLEDNDWDEVLLDSLRKANTNPIDVVKAYRQKVKRIYNLDIIPRDEGVFSTAFAILSNKKQVEDFFAYKTELLGKSKSYNTTFAQALELVKAYEEALQYWTYNLEDPDGQTGIFFYFQRPLNLLMNQLNRPKDAIEFVKKWSAKRPEFALYLNYTIARYLVDKKTEKKEAKRAIDYCIENFKANGFFKIEDAQKLRDALK
ncbi:MAG: alpha/beta hydrolase-fold protein [Chitinophagaceae bacterium]